MWLFFPITIRIHRAAFDPRAGVRGWSWGALAIAGLLMSLSLPVFPNAIQAYGNNLAATALIAAALAWHILHPLVETAAGPNSPVALQPELQNNPISQGKP